MYKRFICLTILSIILGLILPVHADLPVGVKKGDWMEYNISYTGSPPEKREERVEAKNTNIN
jgi:hypothetical protein